MPKLRAEIEDIGRVEYFVEFQLDRGRLSEIAISEIVVEGVPSELTPTLNYELSKHAFKYWAEAESTRYEKSIREMYDELYPEEEN